MRPGGRPGRPWGVCARAWVGGACGPAGAVRARAPGRAECVVGTDGSTCGVVSAAATAHVTPKPARTRNRWSTHILGWNTGRVRPGLVRPRRPLRREPPDLALSAPFHSRDAASPGLRVAATPAARRTASGGRPARRGGRVSPSSFGACGTRFGSNRQGRCRRGTRRRCEAPTST